MDLLLTKLEKVLKTDIRYFIKGGIWLTCAQLVATLSSLGLAVAFANYLPAEIYGTYKYVLAVAAIFAVLSLSELPNAVTQAVARGKEGALVQGFVSNLKWSGGIFIASLCVSLYYFYNENVTLSISILLIGIFSPLITSGNLFTAFLNGKKEFKTKSLFDALNSTLPILILIAAVLLTNNPITLTATYFIANAVAALFFYYCTVKIFKPSEEKDNSMLSYSKHLSLMGAIGKISNHLDKILIFQSLGAAQLAIYAFARAPITEINAIDKIISGLAFPKFSQANYFDLQRTLIRKALFLTAFVGVFALGYILSAPYFFNLLFPDYIEAVKYSQLLAAGLLLTPMSLLINQALVSHKKISELYKIKIIIPTFRMCLIIVLIPLYGLWGAIWALFIAKLARLSLLIYLFKK